MMCFLIKDKKLNLLLFTFFNKKTCANSANKNNKLLLRGDGCI